MKAVPLTCGACGLDIQYSPMPRTQQKLAYRHQQKCKGRKNA